MSLPPFADVPSLEARARLPPEEWLACIESWIVLVELRLTQDESDWDVSLVDEGSNITGFLHSYFLAISQPSLYPELHGSSQAIQLRRLCFLLNHRALSSKKIPDELLQWSQLQSACAAFPKSEELKKLLSSAWKRRSDVVVAKMQAIKNLRIKALDEGRFTDETTIFTHSIPLLHQMPDLAAFLLTGSDLLDSIDGAYSKAEASFRKVATIYVYLGFLGLLTCNQPSISALSDHLYSLSSSSKPGQTSLLSDLTSNTPLLHKIKEVVATQDANRAGKLQKLLSPYYHPAEAKPKRHVRRKIAKGKDRAEKYVEEDTGEDIHVHRMSLITQVQELFPELGSGFIVKLLDEYDDDVEQVTAHLLDESLPGHLSGLDRTAQLPTTTGRAILDPVPHLAPRTTPPPERRNVYDDDELDRLAVDTSRLRMGRANKDLTADMVLADRSSAPNKAAIMSALAAFDSDDDERDDTYDVEDVGGTVDTSMDNDEANADKNEEALFIAYKTSADTFNRDATTRRGKARMALKSETGMTDEAIEGWAIILARDPRKLRRLDEKYNTFKGQQSSLERTAWRDGEGEDTESSGGEAFGGRGRGRGRGRGSRGPRGGRGGAVSGPANEAGTQQARQRKEASKGSRANHNRRDQRARKMARGGFPG